MTRDLILAHRARKAGANYSLRIIKEARRAGLEPLSLAFAVVDQESTFRNVFGADHGSDPALHEKPVTEARVKQLLAGLGRYKPNGVGLPQLTFPPFVRQADAMPGGAALPANQLRVAFPQLAALVHQHGVRGGLSAYNAGDPHSAAGRVYAAKVLAKQMRWHHALAPHAKG